MEQALVKQENIQKITTAIPQAFEENKLSVQRCNAAGERLLNAIESNGGRLNDDLDAQAAGFITKAKRTVAMMNEKRAPFTKLFDELRKEFTSLEGAIDPGKKGTPAATLQAYRNQYAAAKLAEEERKKREEMARRQAEQNRLKMRQDIEEDLKYQFQSLLNQSINRLSELDGSITLANYSENSEAIKRFSAELPAGWIESIHANVWAPAGVSITELKQAEAEAKQTLSPKFSEQYSTEIQDTKDYVIERLPSKKANLERIAKASAEEAQRMKAEMEARRQREAAEAEAERRRKEEEQKRAAEMERAATEAATLFDTQEAVMPSAPTKAKVAKKIVLLNPEGIVPIFSMWWSQEGSKLSVDELAKIFKKQISFCEKVANKEGTFIENENIEYVDDVKAM